MYTINQVESIADEIHTQLYKEEDEIINVVEIAKQLGFDVYSSNFSSDIAGMVINSKDKHAIYVNQSDIIERQRFTIAHEIGHIILHHNIKESEFEEVDYRGKNKVFEPKEYEANNFAAALLMPRKKAIEIWKEIEDLDDFAVKFKVSKMAAAIRLQNLGLI